MSSEKQDPSDLPAANQQSQQQQQPQPFTEEDLEAQRVISTHSSLGSRVSRAATHADNNFGRNLALTRTETAASLAELGLSTTRPQVDPNFPSLRPEGEPEFPEEYTLETETGLVPVMSLRQIRSDISGTSLSRRRTNRLAALGGGLPTHKEEPERRPSTTPGPNAPPTDEEEELPKEQPLEGGSEEEIEFVTFLINDPENPQNWSHAYKWTVTLIASFLVLAVAYGSAAPTGGLSLIMERFNVSLEVANLTVAIMVIGFAVGPLLWSPLSEQIGRRPVYIVSLTLYVIFNIPCAVAKNIGTLLVCRFLCGVFASSVLSLAGGSIADVWETEHRGFAIAYFAAAPYCGPVFGPIVSGWINVGSGRYSLLFWVNFAFAGAASLVMASVPETYAPVILKRRAKRLRKETGNPNIMTEQEALKLSFKELLETVLVRPMTMMLTEPVLDLMNLYIVMIYSLLYGFFFAYPVIFVKLHDYNDGIIGLMFIPILIGAIFALMVTPICEKKYIQICKKREPTPEDRLVGAMIGAPFIPIALYLLGATSYKHVIWVGQASSGIPFGFGMVMCYYSVNNYIIDSYTEYAASALAAKVFMRSGGGAGFCLFTGIMYSSKRPGLQGSSYLLAGLATLMVVIPFLFYKKGAAIRARFTHV
ncbi:uncharacterized protein SAPINGB_P002648 [Magnusiomyces paraingens]|uniref:Major facilitator superfamily (MFS) profile domain-containing protein n=1 Tax=Magnusiomyces paraingens TaxID=2606893 RepID=A0A5E8BF14_9ASCO|nr:uncharacterized protein SAPINGB_P002648 [Saprochaete ingens]VVT50195.1 unnamed protein product [Saprochaete ingens]